MNVEAYLKDKQKIVYETFSKALLSGKLSHAYLLVGEKGTPLLQVGKFFAESILCDHGTPWADLTCETCHRFESDDYPDFRMYNGEEISIKKDEVQDLIHYFEQTPLEKKGIMVYLIHCVENMTVEAINSLLKFLEEPNPSAYAILTCRNEAKVLPTIISRCQTLHLSLLPRQEVLNSCANLSISPQDKDILSFFCNDPSLIEEESTSKNYLAAKGAFDALLPALSSSFAEARYVAESEVIPALKERPALRYFIEMMGLFFQDVCLAKAKAPLKMPSYAKMSEAFAANYPSPSEALLFVMKLRQEADTNINGGLLILHMLYQLSKE
jgi:DNA polymerase III subunit delta'